MHMHAHACCGATAVGSLWVGLPAGGCWGASNLSTSCLVGPGGPSTPLPARLLPLSCLPGCPPAGAEPALRSHYLLPACCS